MPRRTGKEGAVKGETVTIRVTPRLKYAVELLARRQHRSISSVVLAAVETMFDEKVENAELRKQAADLWYLANESWDPREPVRIVNLANRMPELLTPDEEFIWTVIRSDRAYQGEGRYGIDEAKISENWEDIKDKAAEQLAQFGPKK